MNMDNDASTPLSVVFELALFSSDLCVTLSAASRLARSVDVVQFSPK